MEETLGKRISTHRKRLSLTQDQLAEQLGVTAQAVSKWENDQSCPDITTLPRLASIFEITTDELLGMEPKKLAAITPSTEEGPPHDPHIDLQFGSKHTGGNFTFEYDAGRKGGIALGLWVLLTAGLLFLSYVRYENFFTFWDCLWPSGLLIFGLSGLYPKFSPLRLGIGLFGGYYIVNMLCGVMLKLNRGLVLPLFLLFFGLSILTESMSKKNGHHIHINSCNKINEMTTDGEAFRCTTSFGEDRHRPNLSRLSGGTAEVSFGDLTIDLSGCEEIVPYCPLSLTCAFGQLTLLVPRGCKAEVNVKKAFADLSVQGSPAPDAATVLDLNCDASFGHITVLYL